MAIPRFSGFRSKAIKKLLKSAAWATGALILTYGTMAVPYVDRLVERGFQGASSVEIASSTTHGDLSNTTYRFVREQDQWRMSSSPPCQARDTGCYVELEVHQKVGGAKTLVAFITFGIVLLLTAGFTILYAGNTATVLSG